MSSKSVHEHKNHTKLNTVNTSDDDQIDSNIIFDDSYVKNNSGTDEHDSNAHGQSFDIQLLINNVKKEAKNQQTINNELKKQKALLQKELETCKEWVKTLEKKPIHFSKYQEACEELECEICVDKDTIDRLLQEKDKIQGEFFKLENEKAILKHETELAKKYFKQRENKYLDDIVDLEENLVLMIA
ncbi:hypothetical protein Tco_0023211 [Tanacetum coccineum]